MTLRQRLLAFSAALIFFQTGVGALCIGTLWFVIVPSTEASLQVRTKARIARWASDLDVAAATGDPDAARRALGAELEDPDLAGVVLWDADGEVVLAIPNVGALPASVLDTPPKTLLEIDSLLTSWAPVEVEGLRLGAVALSVRGTQINLLNRLLVGLTAVTLISLVLSFFFARSFASVFVRPIAAMQKFAERVAEGRFSQRLTLTAWGELQMLADQLNLMTAALETRDEALARQKTRLERSLEAVQAAEAAEKQARQDALDASHAKSRFLANMSHEIRTPLNGVIGMSELALELDSSPEVKEHLGTILGSARSLLSIVSDILDISKIEADKLEIDNVDLDLEDLIRGFLAPLVVQAESRGLLLSAHVGPEVPRRIVGDGVRIRQVLLNLLGNALKFTREGAIQLHIDVVEGLYGRKLRFDVVDSGVGMTKAQLRHVFEAFAQADSSTTRRFGGTGLGLAISLRLAKLMGGRLWGDSEVEKGSIFHFEIPLEASPCAVEPALAGKRAFVASSDELTTRAVGAQLEHLGADVVYHHELDALLAEADPEGFEWGFVDAFLLDRDDHDTHRLARAQSMAADHVVALQRPGLRASTASFCCGLELPVFVESLCDAITGRADIRRATRGADGSEDLAPQTALRILVAEDHRVNRMLVERLLERMGHEVTLVENGEEAVWAANSRRFDVVLMDLQMPVMDGLDATRAIRAQEVRGDRVPILALTAHALTSDAQRCFDAGMDGYLTKPIEKDKLRKALQSFAPTLPAAANA